MEKGKLYRHKYSTRLASVIILCTGHRDIDDVDTFRGTVVKVTGTCGDKVGDHASFHASTFEPYNKKIII